MILIHIQKENREPEVGEWYTDELIVDFFAIRHSDALDYEDCKTLSLSVILDAPKTHGGFKNTHWIDDIKLYDQHPISNSEEIFQWLHDHGKLGEEWVEWPYEFTHREGDVFCGEADKFYECVVCGSKCGSEGHYIFTEEVFLTGFPNQVFTGFDGNKINEKSLKEETPFQQCLELLRELADLQNGSPLETYRKDWDATMTEVYNFLEKHEKN